MAKSRRIGCVNGGTDCCGSRDPFLRFTNGGVTPSRSRCLFLGGGVAASMASRTMLFSENNSCKRHPSFFDPTESLQILDPCHGSLLQLDAMCFRDFLSSAVGELCEQACLQLDPRPCVAKQTATTFERCKSTAAMSDTLQCTKEASVTQDAAVSRLGLPQHFQLFCSAGTTALEGPDLVPRWGALCRSPQHPPTDPQGSCSASTEKFLRSRPRKPTLKELKAGAVMSSHEKVTARTASTCEVRLPRQPASTSE